MTLLASPEHRLLRIQARLRGGVAMDRPYGLELSALLATHAHRLRKAEAVSQGRRVHSDADDEDPEDFDLPLARCVSGDDWYWAASCAQPDVHPEEAPEARTYFQNVASAHARDFASRPLPEVYARKGSYRDVMMPSSVTLASTLTWFAIGDKERIAAALRPLRAIGRRRATGEGVVLSWSIEDAPGDPWRTLHLGDGDQLLRPVPIPVAEALGVDYRVGAYAIRPPSWNPNRLTEMAMADE